MVRRNRNKIADMIVVDLPTRFDCAYIIPVGDLHDGDPASEPDKLDEYIKWVMERDNAYMVLMGDLANVALMNSVSDTYRERYPARQQRIKLVEKFRPAAEAGKILGMVSGNHEWRIAKLVGDDFSETIARELEIPYHSDELWLKVSLGKDTRNGRRVAYSIYMTHGVGGGRTKGSKANNMHRLAEITDVDVYIVAHSHQIMTFPDDYYTADMKNNVVLKRKRVFVSIGGYLRREGYPARMVLPPSHIGSPRIRLDGKRKDAHVSI